MEQNRCPICGRQKRCKQEIVQGGYMFVSCEYFNYQCFIDEDLPALHDGDETKERTLDLILEQLLRSPFCSKTGHPLCLGYQPKRTKTSICFAAKLPDSAEMLPLRS